MIVKKVKTKESRIAVSLLMLLVICSAMFFAVFQFFNIPSVQASPDIEYLYVDGWTPKDDQWTKVGTPPYLNATDYPTNYIYTSQGGKTDRYYSFQDHTAGGTINSVYVEIYTMGAGAPNVIPIFIWNGSTYQNIGNVGATASWQWFSISVSSILNTWEKVNGARLKLITATIAATVYVDCAILKVDYTPGYNLNLRVMDWDLTDAISGAYVYKDSDVKVSDSNGWANWTGVSGTAQIKVQYFGFWVNGTFSVTMDSDKTITVQCKIFDIYVRTKETSGGYLTPVNVTVFNSTTAEKDKIVTGTTNSSGWVYLENMPNATLRFVCYTPTNIIIENTTQGPITTEKQQVTITCTQNAVSCQSHYMILVLIGSLIFVKQKEKVVQKASIKNRLKMIFIPVISVTLSSLTRKKVEETHE